MPYKIFFSNIGYAKGIDGSLRQHISRVGRHLYCQLPVQEQILAQLKAIIDAEKPDLCCFVEIDQGSFHSANFNQIEALIDKKYNFHDITEKYGPGSNFENAPLHRGKSNAFLSKEKLSFEKLFFKHGSKRLIYKIDIPGNIKVFFAHFSLQKSIRIKQFAEIEQLVKNANGPVIILADFNIFQGFSELKLLLTNSGLHLMNDEKQHTFRFSNRRLALDLCMCSPELANKADLKIIPQPFSDHAALLVSLN